MYDFPGVYAFGIFAVGSANFEATKALLERDQPVQALANLRNLLTAAALIERIAAEGMGAVRDALTTSRTLKSWLQLQWTYDETRLASLAYEATRLDESAARTEEVSTAADVGDGGYLRLTERQTQARLQPSC